MGQFISKPKDWSTEVRSQEDSRYYFLNDRFDLLPSIVDFSFKMPLPPKSEKSSSAAKAVTVVWKYITNSNAFDSKTMYIYGSNKIRKCLESLSVLDPQDHSGKKSYHVLISNIDNIKGALYNVTPVIFGHNGIVVYAVGYNDEKRHLICINPNNGKHIYVKYNEIYARNNYWIIC